MRTSLANDTRVALVVIQVQRNVSPEFLEHGGATREVEAGKRSMIDRLLDDLGCRARDELDDGRWETGFEEDLVCEVVRIDGHG